MVGYTITRDSCLKEVETWSFLKIMIGDLMETMHVVKLGRVVCTQDEFLILSFWDVTSKHVHGHRNVVTYHIHVASGRE